MHTRKFSKNEAYLDRLVLRISQAVDLAEATEVRTVASADSIDVGTSSNDAALVVVTASRGVRSIASLSNGGGGDY